jgi:plastocyanin
MRKTLNKHFVIVTISGILLLLSAPARGDADVYWDSDSAPQAFSPSTVIIGPGENVTWWNADTYGFDLTVTFDNGFQFDVPWFQGVEIAFPSAPGAYGYADSIGDRGTVIIAVAPTVTITAPANNAVFSAPATFAALATASETAGDPVSDVQFLLGAGDNTNLIGDVFSPPYSIGITNLDVGTYTLIAVATDAYGLTATDAIMIAVTAGSTVNLDSPKMSGGNFLFDVNGLTAGQTNIVLVSTDLASWVPVQTNIASSATLTVTNAAATAPAFYRIVQLP